MSKHALLSDLKEAIREILDQEKKYSAVATKNLRLWKLDPKYTKESYLGKLVKLAKENASYEYIIEFDGEYLEKDLTKQVKDAEIADNDLLFAESNLGRYRDNWPLTNDDCPIEANCESCRKKTVLTTRCTCKRVLAS